jgi:transcriptional regulator with XRE-family HTH domain
VHVHEERVDELHERVTSRIRELAEERRISVTHLPDRAGVGRSHFWGVMGGRSSPTLEWLARVAAALEVDVGDLVVAPRKPGPTTAGSGPQRKRVRRGK